jgi:salicylate hydroxylase
VSEPRSFIISGAGIGGLVAAIVLARAGCRVTVIEKAGELQEVGAGVQLSPNVTRLLIELGAGEALEKRVFAPDGIRIFSVISGGEIATVPLGGTAAARYGGPFWTVHRADLHGVLADIARKTDGIRIELDAELRAASTHPGGLTANVAVSGVERTLDAAGLIGADGVHSAVRTRLLDGPVARYTGKMAFRAVIPIGETPMDLRRVGGLWLAPRAHLVHYPVRAGKELNIVAIVDGSWQDESWSAPAVREEVLAQFSTLPGSDWPEVARALVAAPPTWTKWALRGVDPRFEWTGGVVTLIGDAAHAMLPFAAQGACMAIEDAVVLAKHLGGLGDDGDVGAAMRAYEAERKARVSRVWNLSATNGRGYHMGPALGRARDVVLRAAGGARILGRQAWIYDWRPT